MTGPNLPKLPWSRVAFVADLLTDAAPAGPVADRLDLECTTREVLDEVVAALTELGLGHLHFETPASLADAARHLPDAVVLSTYAGTRSRSRLTLVPAAAEMHGLDFVGLDAMGQALAHDKHVMKRVARDCGLLTPPARVVRDHRDAEVCLEFPTPFVVKPLSEGSSIGIGDDSIVTDARMGVDKARQLLDRFAQPVLVEAFVGGREVSMVSIEARPAAHQGFVEVAVSDVPDYFATRLFTADEKLNRRLDRHVRRIDPDLPAADRASIDRLLATLGRYGAVRVDGKLDEGRFHFLELTSDPWLGSSGHVAQAFIQAGWTYAEVIHAILASAPRGRSANG